MPYRYPLWVTGATAWRWGVAEQYQLPDAGHGPYSPWAVFVEALWRRYAGRMTHFEVVNEPNLQLMPQRHMPERVAVMITTVDAIARRHGLAATCLAPSCSDADSLRVPPRMTRQPEFADRLLRCARRGGVRGRRPLGLVVPQLQRVRGRREPLHAPARADRGALARPARARRRPAALRDGGRGPALVHRAERTRGAPPCAPGQAEVLARALARAEATPGLGLYTQYTVNADPDYDCGLRETDGRARPSFDVFVA